MSKPFPFKHAEKGMTRFPPNIEQIRVDRDVARVWLIVRRNDTELKFPLDEADVQHLVALLTGGGSDGP